MPGNTCLYHPWIHFRDDDWVKTSLLFWKRIERIVPPTHDLSDSETIEQFRDAGLIVSVEPEGSAEIIGDRFAAVVRQNEAALRERFGISALRNEWVHRPERNQLFAAGEPVFIHVSKIAWALREELIDSGLALSGRELGHSSDPSWLGVHPEVARVYMTLLATEIANRRKTHPVSESATDLVCVGGWSVETLSSALLNTPVDNVGETESSPDAALAFASLRTVLPEDMRSVSPEKTLEVRSKYGEELASFRKSIHAVARDAELAQVVEPDAFQTHLLDAYEEKVAPRLPQLEKDLKVLGVATAEGWLTIKLTMPPAVGIGVQQLFQNEPAAIGSAVLLGVAGVVRSGRTNARSTLSENPAAYLLHLEREIGPSTLRDRVRNALQRFTFGV